MSKRAKQAWVSLISLAGLIALLLGLFTDWYQFLVGLIIAIALWVGSGILGRYWGVKED
ncbi:MAG: hypothetical protein ACRKGH_05060 [Dehalogenimonas sp.]